MYSFSLHRIYEMLMQTKEQLSIWFLRFLFFFTFLKSIGN